jgi:hypothetical protein
MSGRYININNRLDRSIKELGSYHNCDYQEQTYEFNTGEIQKKARYKHGDRYSEMNLHTSLGSQYMDQA